MATFFEKNPQRYAQWRKTRRNGHRVRPQVVIHTYEAPHTRSLLAAATWLTQRSDPGSYHALCGDDSPRDVLQLAPWSAETWHSVPSNNWSVGISMVAYAHQWKSIPKRSRDNLVKSAAYAAAAFNDYMKRTYNETVPARLLTRAEAMSLKAGFVSHATMDPGRRSDPGKDFPWNDFFAEYRRLTEGTVSFPTPATIAMHVTSYLLNYKNPKSRPHSVYGYMIDASENAFGNLSVRRGGKNISALQELADTKSIALRMEAQLGAQRTMLESLAKALENVSGGEKFDMNKLLGDLETKAFQGAKRAIEEGAEFNVEVKIENSASKAEVPTPEEE